MDNVKVKIKVKEIEVEPWEVLKTIMKTDIDYWRDLEAQAMLVNPSIPETISRASLALFGSNIQLIEYYLEVMEKIENGDIGNQEFGSVEI